jgi:apolipoprotein N-acyltransferase
MSKDKIMWFSLGAGLICSLLAYWIGNNMIAAAENEILWKNEPFWLVLSAWAATLFFFSKYTTTLAARRKMVGASILSGVLLWAGFMPNYVVLAPFVAFVPLLWIENEIFKARAARRTSFWTVFKFAFVAFLTWNFLSTFWVINTGFIAGLLANVLNAILMTIPFILFHTVKKAHNEKIGFLAFATLWLAFEWLHFYWDLSWPWLALGHSFAHLPQLIQWYEWLGVSGGGLWILAANVAIYKAISAENWRENYKQTLRQPALIVLLPMIFSLARYYTYSEPPAPKVEVVLVQPNFEPHYEKFALSNTTQMPRFLELARSQMTDSTAYIVFPETSFDGIMLADIATNQYISTLRQLIKEKPNSVLISGIGAYQTYKSEAEAPRNVNSRCDKKGQNCIYYSAYNSGIQLTNENDSIAIYHKSKLVPGSEIMPFVSDIDFFKGLILDLGGPSGRGLSTQPWREVFSSKHGRVAPIICYESVYGDYVADYTRLGAQAFFVMTNDGWWGDTYGYRQHKFLSSIRAIENRRWVARAANTGTSCFINSRGDVLESTDYAVPAAIKGQMPMLDGRTFFVQWGDFIGRVSCLLAIIVLVSTVSKWITPSKKLVSQMRKDNDL